MGVENIIFNMSYFYFERRSVLFFASLASLIQDNIQFKKLFQSCAKLRRGYVLLKTGWLGGDDFNRSGMTYGQKNLVFVSFVLRLVYRVQQPGRGKLLNSHVDAMRHMSLFDTSLLCPWQEKQMGLAADDSGHGRKRRETDGRRTENSGGMPG